MYCDYDEYRALGGQMSAEQYAVWGRRASRKIDALTLGRADARAKDLHDDLADACAQIADLLLRAQQTLLNACGGAIASVTTDGYSESYAQDASARRTEQACAQLLANALGDDPYGLLQRWVCPCC